MRKLLNVIFLSVTIASCVQTKSNPDKNKQRIDNICDKFMQAFVSGNISEAFQLLKQNTVINTSALDTTQRAIEDQIKNLFPAYGKMISSEFLVERKVKDFITKRIYILRFDKYYLKFDFTLYNSSTGWTITGFTYNDDLIELLY